MKAAILKNLGEPLIIEEINEPKLIPNGVRIKVICSHILSYTEDVFSGKRKGRLNPPVPFIPGTSAVGIVEELAADVYGLKVGQKVFCEPCHQSNQNRLPADTILIGWSGMSPFSEHLLGLWKNGSFAEKAVYPADCVTPILEEVSDKQIAVLNTLLIAYGALLNGNFKASQTVIVNGATGAIGAGAVVLALAMGAAKVIALARDEKTLQQLADLSPRVVSIKLTDDLHTNVQAISEASEERNLLIDVSTANNPIPTLSCIHALSFKGTAVFSGGVQAEIPLPYGMMLGKELTIKGSFMYPRTAPAELLRMIASNALNIDVFNCYTFPLQNINEAIQKASTLKGLDYCVLMP